jgi:hypothetical protein
MLRLTAAPAKQSDFEDTLWTFRAALKIVAG